VFAQKTQLAHAIYIKLVIMKVIFLDRDGVINQEVNYLYKRKDFKFIDGIFEACKVFQLLGYKLIVVTNQSGIARGLYQEEDFHILTKWMLAQFNNRDIDILDVFFCPHGPKSTCKCRKPQPGMFLEARDKYDINMEDSWIIGDKEVDITAANAAGVNNTILVRSGHIVDEINTKAKFILESIKESIQIIT
jgi:D-glycero-D-manno-heptose 1,7-bisphosphate phosphatase